MRNFFLISFGLFTILRPLSAYARFESDQRPTRPFGIYCNIEEREPTTRVPLEYKVTALQTAIGTRFHHAEIAGADSPTPRLVLWIKDERKEFPIDSAASKYFPAFEVTANCYRP